MYTDQFKNVTPGLVIDNGITSYQPPMTPPSFGTEEELILLHQEFFLISASQKFGMPSPTRFTIRVNNVEEASVDRVHLLSYKLCHTYFNIPQAIRVPAPI